MNAVKTYFLDVITKHYFDFNGRADRTQYWLYQLFLFISCFILDIIFFFLEFFLEEMLGAILFLPAILFLLYDLALILPTLGITVRRLHDINFRGWWILLVLVPVLGPLVLFVFTVLPGTEGKNRFN